MQRWGRIVVLAAIFVTLYLLVLAWSKDYSSAKPIEKQTASVQSTAQGGDLPTAQSAPTSDLPQAQPAVAATPVANSNQVPLIQVKTDVYNLSIDPRGGDIVHAELLLHDQSKDSEQPFVLLENQKRVYIAQSGLIGRNGPDENPAGRPVYTSAQPSYALQANQNELIVPLTYRTADGVDVIKTFSFKKGAYPIRVDYRVVNHSTQPWQGQLFGQLKRDGSADPGTENQGIFQLGTYLGGVWGTPNEQYNKLKFNNFNEEKLNTSSQGGWVGIAQHYFVSAWIPDTKYTSQLESRQANGMNIIGFRSPTLTVAPGQQIDVGATLYAGPKIQSNLKALAPGLNQTVDYGWLWPIAKLLFIGLQFFHGLVGNWGWAIILLTCVVKLILFPLSAKSYRSMAKMRVIAPEMQRMKEEFGDDRMRFSQEMMALYKREQVNPLSGCLPILLQMPIFLALYWVLMESVELRHAPWLGWIQDLSAMDPWFILPLIMGVTMYVQQMLNPQPADPMQAKLFRLMPIIFTAFLLFFPAGLVLYWIVNNLLTIAQQWMVNRSIERQSAANKA